MRVYPRPALEPCPPADVLSGFVDGQLDDAQRQQLAVHLADCDVCGAAVAVAVDDGDDDTATRHIPGGAPIDQRSPPTSGSLVGRYSLQEQI
ncbi:MAG: zf-HC2 domain-containing protein, partial [Nannocystaceae bacterium]|nr:zf-HC2 domain-containing protein [Nannocystaceae bacterium]